MQCWEELRTKLRRINISQLRLHLRLPRRRPQAIPPQAHVSTKCSGYNTRGLKLVRVPASTAGQVKVKVMFIFISLSQLSGHSPLSSGKVTRGTQPPLEVND
jgi:hypothetical protein